MSNQNLNYKITLADLFSGKMSGAIKQAERMDDTMNGIGSKIKNIAIGLGAAGLGREILNVGVSFENINAGLKTLLGSAEAAQAVFAQVQKDAATTPFDVEALANANRQLIGAGANAGEARDTILALGNAIAATGGTTDTFARMAANLAQIKSLGKATAADIRQFGFAGIPIYKLLEKSVKGYNKEMDVSYEMLTKAFSEAAKDGGMFFNGLQNGMETTGGKISNLGDTFKNFLYKLYQDARPAIGAVVSGLTKLMDLIIKFLPFIKMAITLWAAYIIKLKLARIESYSFAVAQRAMAMGMSKSAIAMGFMKRGIQGIGAAIKSVPIIGWIAAIVEGIQYLWNTFSGFREAVYGFVESIKQMGDTLILTFRGIWNVMKGTISGNAKMMKEGMIQIAQAGALQLTAANKGIQKGKKSFAESQGTTGEMDLYSLGGDGSKGGAAGAGSLAGKSAGKTGGGNEITSARPQSIIINVNKLVEDFTITTNNMVESASKVKEMVSRALLETLNDANAMARA